MIAFQKAYGLNPDGMVGEETWYRIYNVYRGFLASVPLEYTEGVTLPFPGTLLKLGAEGDDVRLLQEYLNYIARTYTDIPQVTADGIFGTAPQAAVQAFISRFDLAQTQPVVNAVVWDAITGVYSDLYFGNRASEGQYPGYTIA